MEQRPTPGPARPYAFPDVARRTLSNGVRVACVRIPRLPIVTALALVDGGATTDPPGKEGLAALTSLALAEGTTRHAGAALAEQFEILGTGLDVETGWDATIAEVTVTAANVRPALGLLGDVLTSPAFAERDVARLRGERVAEILQNRVEPRAHADEQFDEQLFSEGARYRLPVGGARDGVARLDAASVRGFHSARFRPDAVMLVMAGDIQADGAAALAEDVIGSWRGATQPATRSADEVTGGGRRVCIVHKGDAPQSELRVGHRGLPRSHPDYFPVVVMNALLGSLFNSRINLNLRERNAYTYGARSAFDFRRGAGPFVVSTAVATDVTDKAVREILHEVERMRAETVSQEELSLATSYLDGVFPIRYETTEAVAEAVAIAETYRLGDDYFHRYRERVRAVTAADVRRVASEHLRPDELLVLVVGDATAVRQPLEGLGIGPVQVIEPPAASDGDG